MSQKILVAIDNSEFGQQVFQSALAQAQATGGSLHLLHVLSTEEEGSPIAPVIHYPSFDRRVLEDYQHKWQAFEAHGSELLQALVNLASNAGVKAEFSQKFGHPGRTIIEFARDWGADLIVIGRRGRTGLSELFLGSVSNYVVHRAAIPVLIVQNHAPVAPDSVRHLNAQPSG